MQINNLGGARMPVSTTVQGSAQTARTSFGSLVQQRAGAPVSGSAITGSSIVAKAVSVNAGAIPGSGFGAPYQQAAASSSSSSSTSSTSQAQAQDPTATTTDATLTDEQKQLQDLMKMSLLSIMSGTFAMGQSRPKMEDI